MPVVDHRAEEGRRRERRPGRRARPAADLPARVPDGVPVLRARRSPQRRHHRPVRHAVHAAATTSRRGTSTTTAPSSTPATSTPTATRSPSWSTLIDGAVQPGAVPAAAAQLHRVRRGRRRTGQADRQAAPVLRGHQGRRPARSTPCESNGKAGVVWHTQGSGKSMEMELYANLVMRAPQAARTRPSSSSPTAPSSTASCSRRSGRAGCCRRAPSGHAAAPSCATS